ncbi:hypothetical protein H6501_04515 [Candidatus Woesearchaeota archaeon]|nr:hypothetical protein [Nanoarchaeota archaeon]MCB9370835.1 hypothetical protein [Candidatus Woesearchaeota archaeon]USN43935.1 MAG: hypothetical protein H6500_06115 [Candidatus Woesearchaeota archaeon]
MAKQRGISLPSGQGGLIGSVSSTYHSKIGFSPKFVVVFSLLVVFIIFLLFNI